ncbi:hypothetical protein KC842_02205 [Candidatus Nomurabacteria bacterium]|nr:hypothetical protein [Candidatus Nomurabacteria bacterium]USN94981.1 MAG: hypothetical protein H6791_00945 [Candidatus Nomurabacteria bacterium]
MDITLLITIGLILFAIVFILMFLFAAKGIKGTKSIPYGYPSTKQKTSNQNGGPRNSQ